MPAPRQNQNAVRHGLQTTRLPKGCGWIRRSLLELRRQLEVRCLEKYGEVSIEQASTILDACNWLRHSLLCARWLREELPNLNASDRATFSREISRASAECTKAIRALRLGDSEKALRVYEALRSLPGLDGDETEAEAG